MALTLPIFDGGTRAANTEAARARYQEAAALYRASVRQAVREVEQALVQLQSTDARSDDAASAVRNFQVSLDATRARYDSGLASLFQLEDARRQLFAAQTALVALQQERAQAWVALYRAMGGGWSRREATAAAATAPPRLPDTQHPMTTRSTRILLFLLLALACSRRSAGSSCCAARAPARPPRRRKLRRRARR